MWNDKNPFSKGYYMKKYIAGFVLTIASSMAISVSYAQDFGTYGSTYPIVEKSMIDAIKEKFQGMMDSGEWDTYVQEYKQKTLDGILKPKGRDFPHALTNQTRIFDPTITLIDDIPLPDGGYLARKGDKLNPLDNLGLSKPVLFVDGREPRQIQWAMDQKNDNPSSIIILTDGEWMKQIETQKVRFYFDQMGHLSDRFDIQRTPSKVTQEGKVLKIEEFTL